MGKKEEQQKVGIEPLIKTEELSYRPKTGEDSGTEGQQGEIEHFSLLARNRALTEGVLERIVSQSLIRKFLKAGLLQNGLVSQRTSGTPQGGPLSPLLSNIVLDELDKELEKRDHLFVRYADDCNIYVKSKRASIAIFNQIHRGKTKTESE